MLCIYHIADHDGKGSAAIVKSKFPETELMGLNHDMEIPYEEIEKHDKIVICDIALPVKYMLDLNKKVDLTWIDHHVSVINEYEDLMKTGAYEEIKGIRRVGTAVLVLTWEYFYSDKPLPEGLRLLGLNDIYDLRDRRVRPFEYAMQSCGVNRPTDKIWTQLINNELDIKALVEEGNSILSWVRHRNYRLVRGLAFESEYKGMRCICSNMVQGQSEFFDTIDNIKDFHFMVHFFMNKKNRWNLAFYTARNDIDVSKIAAEFGGGGHAKAAGASALAELPEFLQNGHPWVKPER
ncbi:MAG: DHHA1 domain-containing protein [Alphaproteobacteria bacterium]|nr:DHHA1 domain-containing protein [Alphaproteobacteria bacterium]